MALPEELEELLYAGDGGVGCAAQRHHLPQQDAEAPHVRLDRYKEYRSKVK